MKIKSLFSLVVLFFILIGCSTSKQSLGPSTNFSQICDYETAVFQVVINKKGIEKNIGSGFFVQHNYKGDIYIAPLTAKHIATQYMYNSNIKAFIKWKGKKFKIKSSSLISKKHDIALLKIDKKILLKVNYKIGTEIKTTDSFTIPNFGNYSFINYDKSIPFISKAYYTGKRHTKNSLFLFNADNIVSKASGSPVILNNSCYISGMLLSKHKNLKLVQVLPMGIIKQLLDQHNEKY